MSDSLGFLGAIMFIAVGCAIAGVGGYMWVEQGERIDSFESTEGTVVSSSVGVDEGDSDEGPTYYPDITYRYTVDGERYENTNVLPGPGRTSRGNRDWARNIVQDHPGGKTVTVYYDPADPSTSFLVQQRERMWLYIGGFGGLFVLLGVGAFVRSVFGLVT